MKENIYLFRFKESLEKTDIQLAELKSLFEISNNDQVYFKPLTIDKISTNECQTMDDVQFCEFKNACVIRTRMGIDEIEKIMMRSSFVSSCGFFIGAYNLNENINSDIVGFINEWILRNNYRKVNISVMDKENTYGNKIITLSPHESQGNDKEVFYYQMWTNIIDQWPWVAEKAINEDKIEAQVWIYCDYLCKGYSNNYSRWNYPIIEKHPWCLIYQPLYIERNALYELDSHIEAKPYWKGIDTTPQRLMGAMVNIAKVKKESTILDPFSHTGSLMLEVMKFGSKKIYFNDKFETIGAQDNVKLLTDSPENILGHINKISHIATSPFSNTNNLFDTINNAAWTSVIWEEGNNFPRIIRIDEICRQYPLLKGFDNRLLFYLLRRFYIETNRVPKIFRNKKGTLNIRKDLEKRLTYLKDYADTRNDISFKKKSNGVIEIGYSPITTSTYSQLKKGEDLDLLVSPIPLSESSIDCIITDPPYGYGSYNDRYNIYNLYNNLFTEAFRIIKNNGKVSIATIDSVNIPGPSEIDNRIKTMQIVKLINRIAKIKGIKFLGDEMQVRFPIKDIEQKPIDSCLQYWRASKRLNRGIISFQVNK